MLLYLLWSKSLPPTRLDCRQAKTDLTKCKKSAPRGNPTSGHRLNKSWVTILSVFLAFFFVICNMKNIILFCEKHKHNELVKCPNPLISKTLLVYSKIQIFLWVVHGSCKFCYNYLDFTDRISFKMKNILFHGGIIQRKNFLKENFIIIFQYQQFRLILKVEFFILKKK